MPRLMRLKGEFSTYHIVLRGNERKNIFTSDEDKLRFLTTLERMRNKYNFLLYCYCLMDNHVHLLINDNGNDISKIIKSINISYVYYFNRTYRRCGHLFQDRFKSELIDSDRYLLEVSRYIHNNPVKAGVVKIPSEYKWSSYNAIIGRKGNAKDLVNADCILGYISTRRKEAVKQYIGYVAKFDESDGEIMDIETDINQIDNSNYINNIQHAQQKIEESMKKDGISFSNMLADTKYRNDMMKAIRKNSSLTLKQIGDLFGGLSESRVSRILGN